MMSTVWFRRVLSLAATVLAGLLLAGLHPAAAGPVGSIRVPDTMPSMLPETGPSLANPVALNSAWAQPDHRPLGVYLDNYNLTNEQIEAARSTGCRLVRLAIPMEKFLDEGEQDWAVLDQVVSRLNRAGFEILPVLTAKVAVPEFYVEFCRRVAERYGPTFEYYQLLDNINYKIGLGTRDYADLLSQVRTALVVADRDAKLVSGGIRGADLSYLDLLARQGAVRSIDVIALNLYPPRGAIEEVTSGGMAEHSLPYVERAVEWAESYNKRLWVTSYGVSTSYNWVGVDQAAQAALYARGALYLGWLGAERIIFASIQDTDPSSQRPAECCGLLDVTGAPKASYYALKSLNIAIDGAYHIEPPFLYQGFTFQQPEATDVLMAAELIDTPEEAFIDQFRVYGIPIYAFWFYAPECQEYRLLYWLGSEPTSPTLLTLNLGSIGLTPVERFILLDNAPSPVEYAAAQNFLYLPYQPVSTMPGVIRFEVNEHGRSG